MLQFPKWAKVLFTVFGFIGAFIAGIFFNDKLRWIGNLFKGRKSSNNSRSEELKTGLDKLEANQRAESQRISDIKASGERLDANQQDERRSIDSATDRIDRLDKLLGIKND